MKNKTDRFELRLTEQEKKVLARNAAKNQITISKFICARCVYTTKTDMPIIDITPIGEAFTELHRIGNNLNQLVANYNKYGASGYDSKHTKLVLDNLNVALADVISSLITVHGEAARHEVIIRSNFYDEDEPYGNLDDKADSKSKAE